MTMVARAVIIRRGRMLLAYDKKNQMYFLPGGHVEPGELIEETLKREAREEFRGRVSNVKFIGACENHFPNGPGDRHHEMNIVFTAGVDRSNVVSYEDHIHFVWKPATELAQYRILPRGIASAIMKALRTGRPFWLVRVSR